MPANRIGFSSDFVLVNQQVGIGTTLPAAKLQVKGTLKGDFNVSGVSTLTVYGGFVGQKQNVSLASTTGFSTTGVGTFTQPYETDTGYTSLVGEYNTVSEDLIVDEGKIFEVSTTNITGITTLGTQEVYAPDDSVVSVGTLESVSIQSHFSVPDGGTNERPDQPTEGMVRFNDDLNTLEFYNGIEWRQFTVSGASGRGVFVGGASPVSSIMDYVNISTTGNAVNFGNLQTAGGNGGSIASSTRGVVARQNAPATTIEYITIASAGNGITFGSLAALTKSSVASSSSTRGLFFGGYSPITTGGTNIIEYIQISTLGNALDFGDLTRNVVAPASCSSPTRVLLAGGVGAPTATSKIDSVTIASTGNAVNFGNLTRFGYSLTSLSSSTRGIFGGGGTNTGSNADLNTIDYVTIATFGDAIDFGDLTVARGPYGNSSSNNIRGVFAGGYKFAPASNTNTLDYITIASRGDAIDFGDSTTISHSHSGLSDSHGGLGGF
jgi:hypothetical protein